MAKKKQSSSSKKWLARQRKDVYTNKAKAEGYRSRAVYKLQELDDKYNLFVSGMAIVDLGAAPGGWSQYAVEKVGRNGKVVALDILPIEPLEGVDFIQGDFTKDETLDLLLSRVENGVADLVISDMAPNMTGIRAVDQPRAVYLIELALDLAHKVLTRGGTLLVKAFQGEGIDAYIKELRANFNQVIIRKPKASRAESPEVYLLARGYNPQGT